MRSDAEVIRQQVELEPAAKEFDLNAQAGPYAPVRVGVRMRHEPLRRLPGDVIHGPERTASLFGVCLRERERGPQRRDDIGFGLVATLIRQLTLRLEAKAHLGYRFVGWQGTLHAVADSVTIVRSEDSARPADVIIKKALDGIGTGGGHLHMGGGSVPR